MCAQSINNRLELNLKISCLGLNNSLQLRKPSTNLKSPLYTWQIDPSKAVLYKVISHGSYFHYKK